MYIFNILYITDGIKKVFYKKTFLNSKKKNNNKIYINII